MPNELEFPDHVYRELGKLHDEEDEVLAVVATEDGTWSERYRKTQEDFARRRRDIKREWRQQQ